MATNERHKLRLQWAEVELRLDNGSVGIAEARAALQGLIEKVYRVTPDNTRTFEAAKAACGPWTDPNYWNPDINEDNFALEVVDGEVELQLHHFNEAISDAEATRRLDVLGLVREDRLSVILAFLEGYPGLQREFPIITNAAWVNPVGDRLVVCASGDSRNRDLYLSWDVHGWSVRCRFLVRRK